MDAVGPDIVIILDPNFGDRVNTLAAAQPVWLCGSIENRDAAAKLWAASMWPPDQVTIFDVDDAAESATSFLNILETVDLHHAFWRRLQVIGAAPTLAVKSALAEYGDGVFEEAADGFIFERTFD